MTVRVMLVSPAASGPAREARFDGGDGSGDGLDARGEARARAVSGLPAADLVVRGPSARALGTARALGVRASPEPALADWDMGRWRGLRLDDVASSEPAAVAAWLGDPAAAPHGGESLAALVGRAGGWLDGLPADAGRVLAVAGPAPVRAVLTHALGLPLEAFWRLDVAPLTLTRLSGRAGRWNLRVGEPLGAS
ncbi:histidine phosphatase family protein [Streptomyces sp. NPDC060194]|uniref:histidine phosphatase family protein n=1 Tax=Streptomyces sp. NPDC060194 TaxID=3347069 RepID=UPI003655112B